MRFRNIKTSSPYSKSKGFPSVELRGLGNTVAFVGKNGSGKTRLVKVIENFIRDSFTVYDLLKRENYDFLPEILKEPYERAYGMRDSILENKVQLDQFLKANEIYSDAPRMNLQVQQFIRSGDISHVELGSTMQQIQNIITSTLKSYVRVINSKDVYRIKETINKKVANPVNGQPTSFIQAIEGISNQVDELQIVENESINYFLRLPHILTGIDMINRGVGTKNDLRDEFKQYYQLKDIFRAMFNKELTFKDQVDSEQSNHGLFGYQPMCVGTWMLGDWEFNYSDLSDGEQSLFIYSMILFLATFNPKLNIKECILIVEEPEIHLHADMEIKLLEGLQRIVGEKGQLFITTHSMNLISHFSYDEVFLIQNSKIFRPGHRTTNDIISDLISPESLQRLQNYIGYVSEWSFVNFITQCFDSPSVIETTDRHDPQFVALKNAIEKLGKSSNILLDFGAGKGRLLKSLKETSYFLDKVNYCALEPANDNISYLKWLGVENVYESYDEVGDQKFDFILICNVLHEIDVDKWRHTLNETISCLKNDGHLLIIEARKLTVGEEVGEHGYLLLSEPELQELFKVDKGVDISTPGDEEKIMCVAFPREKLTNVDNNSILRSLEMLEKNTLQKVREIRTFNLTNPDLKRTEKAKIGLKMAFLSQLHINSRIAQEMLVNHADTSEEKDRLNSQINIENELYSSKVKQKVKQNHNRE